MDLHQSDDNHAGNTGQGDLAGLEGNTSVLGALGGSSGGDRRTGAGRSGRLVVGRGDASADERVRRDGGSVRGGGIDRRGDGGDGVHLFERDRLGQDGGRRLSGGRLGESKSRQGGDGEEGELHLDSVGLVLLVLLVT